MFEISSFFVVFVLLLLLVFLNIYVFVFLFVSCFGFRFVVEKSLFAFKKCFCE